MKLRSMAVVMLGVGALAAAGCKKKPKEGKAPDQGTASMGTGAGTGGSMAGTGAGTGAEAPKEAKLEGKALADRYLECMSMVNDKKWDDFKSKCISADFKVNQADGPGLANVDATLEFFKMQSTAFPDLKLSPQLVMVSGRNIIGVFMMTGTHTGVMKSPMGEIPPTNKKVGQLAFHKLAINDENKATEEWEYYDPGTMIGQLGLMPKGAPPMRPALEKGWDGAPIIVVAAETDVEKKNLEVVKKGNEAFMAKKPADWTALYTDDAFEADQAGDKDMKGKKEIQAGAETFLKAFPDIKLETKESFAAGDYVATIGTFSGTNTGPLGPMKPTKKPVTGQYAEVFLMKDGKIAGLWRFRNGMAMAQQLGLAPPPGGAPGGDAPKGDAPKGDAPKGDAPKGDMKKDEGAKKSG